MRFALPPPLFRFLPVLLATLPLLAGGADALFVAKRAIEDRLPEMAEAEARSVYADKSRSAEERDAALDILFQSLVDQHAPERILETLEPGGLDGPPIPDDGRTALWRSSALLELGRADEALKILRKALPFAANVYAARIRRLIPPTVLATGDTNAALRAYADLRAVLTDRGSPDVGMPTLERARIFNRIGRPADALAELDSSDALSPSFNPESPLTGLQAAARLVRADALLHSDAPAGTALLEAIAADETEANAPYRADACLLLAEAGVAKDAESALQYAQKAVELASGTATELAAWTLMAKWLYSLGRSAEARPFLDRILADRRSTPSERTAVVLDCASLLASDPQTALALYDELLQNGSGIYDDDSVAEARAHYGRGECLLAQKQPDAAAVAFLRAEEIAGDAGDSTLRDQARFQAAQSYWESQNLEEAARLFGEVAGAEGVLPDSQRARAALRRAQVLERLDPDRCEETYKELLNTFPNETEVVQSACLRFAAMSLEKTPPNYSEAHSRYKTAAGYPAVASSPSLYCSALIGAGIAATHSYDFDEALDAFTAAANTDATNAVQATYLRIGALYNLGDEDSATNACLALMKEHADSPWAGHAAHWFGIYLYNRRMFAEAATYLLDYVRLCPDADDVPDVRLVAANALLNAKAYEDAKNTAKELVENHPDSRLVPEALLLEGEAQRAMMLYAEARLLFRTVSQTWPGSRHATRARRLEGSCLFALGAEDPTRYKEAIECFQSLLDGLDPLSFEERLEIQYRIGRCRERQDDLQGAFNAYYDGVICMFDQQVPVGDPASDAAVAWYQDAVFNAADLADRLPSASPETPRQILRRIIVRKYPLQSTAEERLRSYQH